MLQPLLLSLFLHYAWSPPTSGLFPTISYIGNYICDPHLEIPLLPLQALIVQMTSYSRYPDPCTEFSIIRGRSGWNPLNTQLGKENTGCSSMQPSCPQELHQWVRSRDQSLRHLRPPSFRSAILFPQI